VCLLEVLAQNGVPNSCSNREVNIRPVSQNLTGMVLHVDASTRACLPANWDACVAERHGLEVGNAEVKRADAFIAKDPWHLQSSLVMWVAVLKGAWVLAPRVYSGELSGPALRLLPALKQKRQIWPSDEFKRLHLRLWVCILEVMSSAPQGECQWTILPTAVEFATAKAKAEKSGNNASVLALVASAEASDWEPLRHVFSPVDFLKFITKKDVNRTSFGLGSS
jgi:hypothetical protein